MRKTLHGRKRRLTSILALTCSMALVVAACGDDSTSTSDDGAAAPGSSTEPLVGDERCQANRDAGTITFLTGFGFFPSVSVADVITAQEKGYFDEMCLTVDIEPSLPGESMVLVSANNVQFAANSFGSIARGVDQGADVAAVINYGWVPIQVLLVPEDSPIQSLEEFDGTTIASTSGDVGVPIASMLATAGLSQGEEYLAQASGFDPFVITNDEIAGKASYRSNDPDTLARGGVPTRAFNPEDYGATATFGAIIGSNKFIRQHPTAAEDWVRAVLKGWEYAIDPANAEEVVGFSEALTQGDFDLDHEVFRWTTERDLAIDSLPDGRAYGEIEPLIVGQEMAFIYETGILGQIPDIDTLYTNDLVQAVYDESDTVVWPGPIGE